MDAATRAHFTPAAQARVAAAVGVDPDALRPLGGFESFVFETRVRGRPHIVKATWHGRRTPEEVGAELHFVNAMADGGAPVCRALPLADGALVATVPAGDGAFHVSAFAKAPGGLLPRERWTEQTFETWGAAVGQLHRLAAAYPGPPPPLARPPWEREIGAYADLCADEPALRERFQALLARIAALPRERGVFGPIHTDLHRRNVHWHEGAMYIFDFEDMVDFWFVSDLAIVLYYALINPLWQADRQADLGRIRPALLAGYAREWRLPDWSWEALPLFMALREHTLRAVILRSVPPEERGEETRAYLAACTRRILDGAPALGLSL